MSATSPPRWSVPGRNGRPRIIRKVTKVARDGRPKIAVDRKAFVTIERVKASRGDRDCTFHACPHGKVITRGTEYAKVSRDSDRQFMNGRMIPRPRDFHFECVPPEARPLLRFFKPREET